MEEQLALLREMLPEVLDKLEQLKATLVLSLVSDTAVCPTPSQAPSGCATYAVYIYAGAGALSAYRQHRYMCASAASLQA